MSVCMRSADTAFHIREKGNSLGTAPAPQNRLPPLGSDCCINSMCLCQSSLGPLPLCMPPVVSMLSREMRLWLCGAAKREESSRCSNLRYSWGVLLQNEHCCFYPQPNLFHESMRRVWIQFLLSWTPLQSFKLFFNIHKSCRDCSEHLLENTLLYRCVWALLAKYLLRVFYSVICGALMCGESARPSVGQADAEGQSEGCVTWQKSLGAGWCSRQILCLQWAYWHLPIAPLSTEGSPNSFWC